MKSAFIRSLNSIIFVGIGCLNLGLFAQGSSGSSTGKSYKQAAEDAAKAAEAAKQKGTGSARNVTAPQVGPNGVPAPTLQPSGIVDAAKQLVTDVIDESCPIAGIGTAVLDPTQVAIDGSERLIDDLLDLDGNPANNLTDTAALDGSSASQRAVNEFVLGSEGEVAISLNAVLDSAILLKNGTASADAQLKAFIEKAGGDQTQLQKTWDSLKAKIEAALKTGDAAQLQTLETDLKTFLWKIGGRPALASLGISEADLDKFETECRRKFGW